MEISKISGASVEAAMIAENVLLRNSRCQFVHGDGVISFVFKSLFAITI